MPLERRCVRFLDNFSAGTRGAASVECAALPDPDSGKAHSPNRIQVSAGAGLLRRLRQPSALRAALRSATCSGVPSLAHSRALTRLLCSQRKLPTAGPLSHLELTSEDVLQVCLRYTMLTLLPTHAHNNAARSLHILRICTSCGRRCAQPATQARPFQLAKCCTLMSHRD